MGSGGEGVGERCPRHCEEAPQGPTRQSRCVGAESARASEGLRSDAPGLPRRPLRGLLAMTGGSCVAWRWARPPRLRASRGLGSPSSAPCVSRAALGLTGRARRLAPGGLSAVSTFASNRCQLSAVSTPTRADASSPPPRTSPCSRATTPGSASVVVSPSARPSAMSRSRRRMILPLRVFGRSAREEDVVGPGDGADLLRDVLLQVVAQLGRRRRGPPSA